MNGLIFPLCVMFLIQSLFSIFLTIPLSGTRTISYHVHDLVRNGPGFYVAGTLLVMLVVLFASSIGEVFNALDSLGEEGKAMMLTVQATKAQFSAALNFANIMIAIVNTRYAKEIGDCEKLRMSHEALRKQATGLTEEYKRATTLPSAELTGDDALKARLQELEGEVTDLREEAAGAHREREGAQKLADDIKTQAKSLEESYDTLMRDHIKLKEEAGQAAGDKKTT